MHTRRVAQEGRASGAAAAAVGPHGAGLGLRPRGAGAAARRGGAAHRAVSAAAAHRSTDTCSTGRLPQRRPRATDKRPAPRSILTEVYRCPTCSDQEYLLSRSGWRSYRSRKNWGYRHGDELVAERLLRRWRAASRIQVSHFLACIGSLCLRHCVHGASIGVLGGLPLAPQRALPEGQARLGAAAAQGGAAAAHDIIEFPSRPD
jgi:hypothetical protein